MRKDPLKKLSYRKWLAADESERMVAVLAYLKAKEFDVPSFEAHAAFHVTIETQLAMDVFPVRSTLSRLMDEGLDRHDAIHAIGSVLAHHLFRVIEQEEEDADFENFQQEDIQEAYAADLLNLTAESWLEMADEDFDDESEYEEDFLDDLPDLENLPSRLTTEKLLRDITASLKYRDFESEEELHAALDELIQAGELPVRKPEGDLDRAQDLMYQAWEKRDPYERIKMAHEALRISDDCTDAYMMLADYEAETFEEKADLYREAIQVGERVLGERFFYEN